MDNEITLYDLLEAVEVGAITSDDALTYVSEGKVSDFFKNLFGNVNSAQVKDFIKMVGDESKEAIDDAKKVAKKTDSFKRVSGIVKNNKSNRHKLNAHIRANDKEVAAQQLETNLAKADAKAREKINRLLEQEALHNSVGMAGKARTLEQQAARRRNALADAYRDSY